MQSWKHTSKGEISLVSTPYTKPTSPDIVKIRIEKALISYGDYLAFNQTPVKEGITLGRYAVGAVSEAAEQYGLDKATRVVIAPTVPCNQCENCKKGSPCAHPVQLGEDENGVYCDFADIPAKSIYRLPETVSYDDALFLAQISLALNAMDAVDINKGEHVAIVCDTKLGLLLCQLATYYGAIPVLIQRDEQMALEAKKQGVFYVFNGKNVKETEKNVFTVTGGRLCEKAVYVRNSLYACQNLFGLCSVGAKTCLILSDKKDTVVNVTELVNKEITLVGVCGNWGNYPTAINLLATKAVNVDYLKGERIKFQDIGKRFEALTKEELNTKSITVDVD